MISARSLFYFDSYQFDAATKTASFVYRYDDEVVLTETLRFETSGNNWNTPAFDRLLFSLHIALGMSYWKAYCPKEIVVNSGTLSPTDAAFWEAVYTKGLGEFFYHNQIDFHELVHFPSTETASNVAPQAEVAISADALVPLGGGKDSLTTVTLLERAGIAFETVSLGQYDVIEQQVTLLGSVHHRVHRVIDPALFALNSAGAYNGHVPISVIYAFSSLAIAVLNNKTDVVLSNEASANEGNVSYLGVEVNHQWSKSVEFEDMLSAYLAEHEIPVRYFSLLRPLHEIQIVDVFTQSIERFRGVFTSCNRNFTQTQRTKEVGAFAYWCGECPKCLFVGTMLAASISREQLIEIIGTNPLNNAINRDWFLELLGVSLFKPFECVGTPDEMIVALERIRTEPAYANDLLVVEYNQLRDQLPVEDAVKALAHIGDTSRIPAAFQDCIEQMNTSIL